MTYTFQSTIVAATIAALATTATAGGHEATEAETAMKARGAHMQLFSFNLGTLGALSLIHI